MKRCPECIRDYCDETLLYCLDDGTRLLEGPTSGSATSDEPATAIIHTADAVSDAPTRAQIHTTEQSTGGELPEKQSSFAPVPVKRLVILGVAVTLLIGGFLGYRYLGSNTAQIESIAVMPFVNESGNAEVEYLSDGMTETLINNLSQLPNLSVKARSSVFHYKGKEVSPQTVGSELSVQAVLNGRVIQRGDSLTLSLELVDARTGNQIWGEQYNRKLTDIVTLQTEIARDVSNKLQTKLLGANEQKLAKNYTSNAEAYQLYLKGRFYWNKRTPKDLQKAIEYFEQAVALEPNYALGYAGLADAYMLFSLYGGALSHEKAPRAREAALKALSLDDNLAEAHAALGQILHNYDYDFAGAKREYSRAIELSPNYASARQWRAEVLANEGKFEESFAEFRRALEIDPFSLVINRMYGLSLYYARQYDASIAQLKKTVELDANYPGAHNSLAAAYQVRGNHAESVEEWATFLETYGNQQKAALMRESFAKGGWQEFLRTMTGGGIIIGSPAYSTAVFYVALGEKDKAFVELNKSYENREASIVWLKLEPRFDPLRDDPRFTDLMRRVGLPQ